VAVAIEVGVVEAGEAGDTIAGVVEAVEAGDIAGVVEEVGLVVKAAKSSEFIFLCSK